MADPGKILIHSFHRGHEAADYNSALSAEICLLIFYQLGNTLLASHAITEIDGSKPFRIDYSLSM